MASNPSSNVKKFLPKHMLEVFGKNLPALYEAINTSNEATEKLLQACIDNLFLNTANGRYLINLAEEQGFTMPPNSGLDIRGYKAVVPIMVAAPKQVRISIQDLVKVFYGSERTKPNITSSVEGPYSLQAGDDIAVQTDSGSVTIVLSQGQVSDFSNVTASEIAAVINYSQDTIVADTIKDRVTGAESLRLLSTTPGVGAFIQITGGTLQNVLKFPKLADTKNASLTSWIVEKDVNYTDIIKFTWDGAGVNPEIYLTKSGDFVTIRGLVDGSDPFSLLNGSYQIVDSGFDYFIIKNKQFDSLSSILVQNLDNNIVFTKNEKNILFDRPEYAFVSEIENQTVTVTVPAIPPLAKRFLKGSTHLRGQTFDIIDFTRNSLQINLPPNLDKPIDDNQFIIFNDILRPDYKTMRYRTVVSDGNPTQPTYIVETNFEENAVLPFTTAELVGSNPIRGEVGSEYFEMTFPFRHGLQFAWGFTLSGATGSGNITNLDLNQEHQVNAVVDQETIKFRIRDTDGTFKKFEGVSWGVPGLYPDVYRHTTIQADGSDFYLQFPTILAAANSGLVAGTSFKLDPFGGTNVDAYFGNKLRTITLSVTSVVGNKVNFRGVGGPGPTGLIISGIYGTRSGSFGGTVSYYFDKTSAINQEKVMTALKTIFVHRTPSSNPDFVGSFLFDPQGKVTFVNPSKYTASLTTSVLKGDNPTELIVDRLQVDGVDFPKSGQIILGYGTDNFEGPISYFSTLENLSQNQILIDPSYKFKKTHLAGEVVQYIHSATPYVPKTDGSDYSAYITGTKEARDVLFELVSLLTASGIFVNKDVILPDNKYDDPAISIFD